TLIPSLWSLRPRPVSGADGPTLTLMSINLFFGNDDIASIKTSIEHDDPDVILLQEYTPQAAAKLDPLLRDRYPHVLDFSRDGAFGQAIFSRKPFIGRPDPFPHQNPLNEPSLPPDTVAYNQPQIRVVVEVGGREVMIQNTHLPAPVSLQFFRDQRVWIQWLIQQAQAQSRPIIYAGDFNATQQSTELAALRQAGLTSALDTSGTGRCATWPHQHWLKYVPGVRIDQFMSRGITCEWAHTGFPTGSDHLPIVARFR
ncbi:MAG: endonuclease/exonuclease/phosphatase family protein, partial [Planctomycetota bacterium]|nr:endonuclease/exonuclease/phosphatase family protein [Planctomycetota bacterium]